MEPGSYGSSSSGERASERPIEQCRLAVNQSGDMPVRRFESCRGRGVPGRVRPAAAEAGEGQKL
jgi:hypothetical protein